MVVNGRPVVFADGVALNGAIHVVDRLVLPLGARPPPGRGHGPRGAGRRDPRDPLGIVDEAWTDWAGVVGDEWVEDLADGWNENEWEDWEGLAHQMGDSVGSPPNCEWTKIE